MNNSYIKSLDGLRGIAILLVMTYHAHITSFGRFGVQLFFALSGFLITGILWKEKYAEEPLFNKFRRFWIRRSFRIFPLYFFYLLLIWIVYLIFKLPEYYPAYFPYLVTYIFNFTTAASQFFTGEFHEDPFYTHLWSLCVEEQFYLVFPFFILLAGKRTIKFVMVAVILISPLIRHLLFNHYLKSDIALGLVSNAVYTNTLSHLDAFFLGGIIPVLSLEKNIKKPGIVFMFSALLFIGAGLFVFLTANPQKFYYYQYTWFYSVLNLFSASLILGLRSMHIQWMFKIIRYVLENKWLVAMGKVSYGMYIYHWAILAYLFQPFLYSENMVVKILLFIPYVLVVYLISQLSYNKFELYFIKLKDVYADKKIKVALKRIEPSAEQV